MDKSQLGSYICYLGVCIALMLYSFSAYALFAGDYMMATPLYLSGTAVLFVSTLVCVTLKKFKGCLPPFLRARFGQNQNVSQTLPEVLRIRRTHRNPTDNQSNASSNDDVIGMLITSRHLTNRRRTTENELGMNESQFVSVDSVQNTSEDGLDSLRSLPRDDPPPPYSEIAHDSTTQSIWMANRPLIQQGALGGPVIQQRALGGQVIPQSALGQAIIHQGTLGGAIIQQSALGGPVIQQSALGGAVIPQSALAGAIIQHNTLGGPIFQQSALGGTSETSFSNVECVAQDRSNAPNVIRGYIINSAMNMPGTPRLNIICDNNVPAERAGQGPVILNLEVVENEVPNNDLPSYEEYLKSQNDCD